MVRDADIEMMELQEVAKRESWLKKNGKCTHGWRQGSNPTNGIPDGLTKCLECGKLATWEELEGERRELLI